MNEAAEGRNKAHVEVFLDVVLQSNPQAEEKYNRYSKSLVSGWLR